MALVNGGYLHYTDMKKFLKILLHWNRSLDFEIISPKFKKIVREMFICQ